MQHISDLDAEILTVYGLFIINITLSMIHGKQFTDIIFSIIKSRHFEHIQID